MTKTIKSPQKENDVVHMNIAWCRFVFICISSVSFMRAPFLPLPSYWLFLCSLVTKCKCCALNATAPFQLWHKYTWLAIDWKITVRLRLKAIKFHFELLWYWIKYMDITVILRVLIDDNFAHKQTMAIKTFINCVIVVLFQSI